MITYTFDDFTEQFTADECEGILVKFEQCGYASASRKAVNWKPKAYWNYANSENRSVIWHCVPNLPNEDVYIEDGLSKTFWFHFWQGWKRYERDNRIVKQN